METISGGWLNVLQGKAFSEMYKHFEQPYKECRPHKSTKVYKTPFFFKEEEEGNRQHGKTVTVTRKISDKTNLGGILKLEQGTEMARTAPSMPHASFKQKQ